MTTDDLAKWADEFYGPPAITTVTAVYIGDEVVREWSRNEQEMQRRFGKLAYGCYVEPPSGKHWHLESVEVKGG